MRRIDLPIPPPALVSPDATILAASTPAALAGVAARSFVSRHDHELTAAASLLLAVAVAVALDRAFARRGRVLAAAVGRDELSPVAQTRLRFVRRLVTAGVVVLGAMVAIAQFGALSRLAAGVLASGALAAAVVGFAARQTLANAVAGVMLAITQPLRIGDLVTFEGETGTVEDVGLNYTYVRAADGAHVVIPNERLAGGVLRNETIVSPLAEVAVSAWLARDADVDRALAHLADLPGVESARVAEISSDGVRIDVSAGTAAADGRPAAEAELRAACLRALRVAGVTATE